MELGLRLSIHRIFQVYGPGESELRLWPSLRAAAREGRNFELTPAEQIRDFVPVEEVARQLLEALRLSVKAGRPEVLNLGTGHPKSLREFAEGVWRAEQATGRLIFGAKPYRDGEVMRYVPEV
jgi:nucleoside-diphosphate-sugar epimerase